MAPIIRLFERADPASTQTNTALTQLPESVLSTIGALAPPAGVTANFVNPDSIRGVLIATSSVGIAVLIICVGIRAWTIFKLLGKPIKWAWSDVTFTLGALFSLATFITLILTTTATGQVGVHQWDAPLSKIFATRSIIPLSMMGFLTPLSLGFIKITIFLTYIELFSRNRWIRISCWVGAALTGAFYLAIMIASVIFSFPHSGETYVTHLFSADSNRAIELSIPTAAVGMAIDIYLFIVPLVAVSGLKMKRRKKIGVASLFATGIVAVIASIISLIYRAVLDKNGDHTWNLVAVWAVTSIELFVGIIIACTPHIAKFGRRYDSVFYKVGSFVKFCFCCRCISFKGVNSKKSRRWSGWGSAKSSEVSETLHSPRASKASSKPEKLYPGLEVTTVGGTIWETNNDNTDEKT
ncbi:hypothetical protein OCU04_012369 [Sclerotinia nivalis]|uniref:Rhodopsin domain-containing protein n=1 Tax=Sclerotinia nivalis TaxID=352851 RepID=A0A9X0AB10_9HELO|nr:hypothetical protein OCU04_012369 [Sclerotinia nivalis]